jgi:hypothetical protein
MRLLLSLTGLTSLAACTPAPEWGPVGLAHQSAQGSSTVFAAATDSVGNVYLAGDFDDTIYFDTTRLISAGLTDAFIAKWNSAQN